MPANKERLIYIFHHPAENLNINLPLFISSGGILNHEESDAMVLLCILCKDTK
jgi:hypothetical protein